MKAMKINKGHKRLSNPFIISALLFIYVIPSFAADGNIGNSGDNSALLI
jgi:hypothetical protein